MMKRTEKEALLKEVSTEAKAAKSLVFADYKSVTVKQLSDLRGELRKDGSRFKVLKKTILDLALRDAGIDVDARKLEGQVGVTFSSDEVSAAKVIAGFIKENKETKLSILGGALEGKGLSAEEVNALAKLPTKDEMRAKLVGTIQAPVASFVRTLSGTYGGFVRTLDAIAKREA